MTGRDALPIEFAIRLALEGTSPLARILDAAWYAPTMPSREMLVDHFEHYVRAWRAGDLPALSRDRLSWLHDGTVRTIDVDLANGQFMGAALTAAPFSQGYETDILACIAQFLPNDGVFYDVGSNWGYFAFHLLLDPEFIGRVVAFEPVRHSMNDLLRLARVMKTGDRLTPVQLALGDGPDVVHISADAWSGNQSVAGGALTGELVKVAALDSLDLPPPGFIKFDVENHEAAALMGARATIAQARPVIMFESWKQAARDAVERPFDILGDLGYSFFLPVVTPTVGALELGMWWRGTLSLTALTKETRGNADQRINVLALPA
jgi:FkbM family methyltransferase